jgi:hypothetical protein
MPTRTISNAGGNYNAVGTWVEGIVPTSADDVVSTATSGQLTMNVAGAALSLNLSNYTNTLTMTNALTVTNNITLGASMSFAGTGALTSISTATITTNGRSIPSFTIASANTVKTLADNLSATTYSQTAVTTLNGNSMFITGNFNSSTFSILGTSNIRIAGSGAQSINCQVITAPFIFQHSGTVTINSEGLGPATNGSVTYTSGSFASNGAILKLNSLNGTVTLNTSGMTWDRINVLVIPTTTLSLTSNLNFTNLFVGGSSNNTANNLLLTGVGRLNGGTLYLGHNSINTGGLITYVGTNLSIPTGTTNTLANLYVYGMGSGNRNTIRSATPGTQATLNVTGISSANFTQFTDIIATNPIDVLSGATSNTTGITIVPSWGSGGGGGGGSFTFVN